MGVGGIATEVGILKGAHFEESVGIDDSEMRI